MGSNLLIFLFTHLLLLYRLSHDLLRLRLVVLLLLNSYSLAICFYNLLKQVLLGLVCLLLLHWFLIFYSNKDLINIGQKVIRLIIEMASRYDDFDPGVRLYRKKCQEIHAQNLQKVRNVLNITSNKEQIES